jgi:hypothetical protein
MPRSDTLAPMSVTSDHPTTSTLDQNDSTTMHFLGALWEENPDGAAAILGHFQRSNPRGAASALAALARGGREERELLCLLRLSKVDPVAADPLLAACLGQCSPSSVHIQCPGVGVCYCGNVITGADISQLVFLTAYLSFLVINLT